MTRRPLVLLAAVLVLAGVACSDADPADLPASREAASSDGACAESTAPAAAGKPIVVMPQELTGELQVTDLVEGDGAELAEGDTITVHYVGVSCSTGEQFDSSWDRGQPATFPLVEGQLIEGWVQGIPGMKVGGQRQLVIPPELGYGDNPPAGSGIAAGDTLVFVVEAVDAQAGAAAGG